jgi:hypothetical protein
VVRGGEEEEEEAERLYEEAVGERPVGDEPR